MAPGLKPALAIALLVGTAMPAAVAHAETAPSCFDLARKRNPSVEGKIVLTIDISGSGQVTSVTASENTTGDDELAACLKTRVQTWKFPARGKPAHISYPFVFKTPSP